MCIRNTSSCRTELAKSFIFTKKSFLWSGLEPFCQHTNLNQNIQIQRLRDCCHPVPSEQRPASNDSKNQGISSQTICGFIQATIFHTHDGGPDWPSSKMRHWSNKKWLWSVKQTPISSWMNQKNSMSCRFKRVNSAILCRLPLLHPNSNAEKSLENGNTARVRPAAPRRHCFVTCYPLETPELPATKRHFRWRHEYRWLLTTWKFQRILDETSKRCTWFGSQNDWKKIYGKIDPHPPRPSPFLCIGYSHGTPCTKPLRIHQDTSSMIQSLPAPQKLPLLFHSKSSKNPKSFTKFKFYIL